MSLLCGTGALEPQHAPLLAAWADFEAAAGNRQAAKQLRRRCEQLQAGAGAARHARPARKQHAVKQGAGAMQPRRPGQQQLNRKPNSGGAT